MDTLVHTFWETIYQYLPLWLTHWGLVMPYGVRKLEQRWFRLTHWGRVTHICVVKLTIIGSDNGLSPGRCQAIIWTNAGILLIGPLGTNFSEISIGILIFSFKKMCLKVLSTKWRPLCLGLNVLKLAAWQHQAFTWTSVDTLCQSNIKEHISMKYYSECLYFHLRKYISNWCLQNISFYV